MSHGNKQQWILAKRPEGMPDSSEVILQDAPIPETPPGMLLVRNHYISLDPAIRGWMSDIPNYLPPIPIGDPVRATVVGEVLESGCDHIKAGDYVFGLGGWETHSTIPVEFCTPVPEDNEFPLHYYVNILGAVGLTPYFAIAEVGEAKAAKDSSDADSDSDSEDEGDRRVREQAHCPAMATGEPAQGGAAIA